MNVSRIQSCVAAHAPRRWSQASNCRSTFDRSQYEVRNGPDGDKPYDAYCPSNIASSPIQPPWRILSWPGAASPVKHRVTVAMAAVKAAAGTADVSSVGRTLDLFV